MAPGADPRDQRSVGEGDLALPPRVDTTERDAPWACRRRSLPAPSRRFLEFPLQSPARDGPLLRRRCAGRRTLLPQVPKAMRYEYLIAGPRERPRGWR